MVVERILIQAWLVMVVEVEIKIGLEDGSDNHSLLICVFYFYRSIYDSFY